MDIDSTTSERSVNIPAELLNRLLERLAETASPENPSSHRAPEPTIADAPMFTGDRKMLLPFLTKCRMKFAGQSSQFPSEESKFLYADSRLEGPAFSWFQPLLSAWQTEGLLDPLEIATFEAFATALTALYGDADLETTAERELCQLRQTSSVADYAAKFEQHRQYLGYNDLAFQHLFYHGLKE